MSSSSSSCREHTEEAIMDEDQREGLIYQLLQSRMFVNRPINEIIILLQGVVAILILDNMHPDTLHELESSDDTEQDSLPVKRQAFGRDIPQFIPDISPGEMK